MGEKYYDRNSYSSTNCFTEEAKGNDTGTAGKCSWRIQSGRLKMGISSMFSRHPTFAKTGPIISYIHRQPYGFQPESYKENLISELRNQIETLPEGEDLQFIFHIAAALHVIVFAKIQNAGQNNPPFRDVDELIQHALDGEWGYSCYDIPSFTTKMTSGCIFFSDNRHLNTKSDRLNRIAILLKTFSDIKNLKTAAALYQITFQEEDLYASISNISRQAELCEETAGECLNLHLSPFLNKKVQNGQTLYRFTGSYMELIPSLMMLDTVD